MSSHRETKYISPTVKQDIALSTTCRKMFFDQNLPIYYISKRLNRDEHWISQVLRGSLYGHLETEAKID